MKSFKDLLSKLPISVLRFLHDRHAVVSIIPAIVESDYRLQNSKPRGYDSGSTWKNNSAYCHGKKLYISQYRLSSKTGNYEATDTEVGSIRHEVGHAIDYCLGYISQEDEFRHSYRLEAAQVPAEHRQLLDYYLQQNRGGPSETFAELCCAQFGGETGAWSQKACLLIQKYFTNTGKILKRYLASIEKKYGD